LDKKGGNFLNKKNNDDEHEDDFDKNDEWGDLWGNFKFLGSAESDINKRKYKKNVNLLTAIDPDHAKARYQNGILEIKLNKITGKAKNISID